MKTFNFATPPFLTLLGSLTHNSKNSFITLPLAKPVSHIDITQELNSSSFIISTQKDKLIINFHQTQKLSSPYQELKQIFEIFFTQIYQTQDIPGLNISLSQNISNQELGGLSAIIIKALNQFFPLNLDDTQIIQKLTEISPKINPLPQDFIPGAYNALFQKPLFFDYETNTFKPLDLSKFYFLFFDLKKNLNPRNFKDYSNSKKYNADLNQFYQKLNYIVSEAKNSINQEAPTQLGEFLTKNQKLLNNFGFNSDLAHKLFVLAMLAGAYGSKIFFYEGSLYYLVLTNLKSSSAIVSSFKKENIHLASFNPILF